MWVLLKGLLLGMLIFLIIFAARFHRVFTHSIIGPDYLRQITTHSVMFWVGLVGCVLVGCTIVWYWTPSRPV